MTTTSLETRLALIDPFNPVERLRRDFRMTIARKGRSHEVVAAAMSAQHAALCKARAELVDNAEKVLDKGTWSAVEFVRDSLEGVAAIDAELNRLASYFRR